MFHTVNSHSPEETQSLGQKLGLLLQTGDLICLQGSLGAGKTTFTQGIAAGWGSTDAVSSPTFVLVNIYRRADKSLLYHLDTYRIEDVYEAEELDIDSMLEQGPVLIEWPENVEAVLPKERLVIRFSNETESHRTLQLQAFGARAEEILKALH